MSSVLDRVCPACNKSKFIIEFYTTTKLLERCKSCLSTQESIERKFWSPEGLFTRAKAAAKQQGRPFTLLKESYIELIKQSCYYCSGKLNNEKNRGIGLDRIDNSRGYEEGNVIRSCGFCNKTRGDRLSVVEMKKVAEFIIRLKTTNSTI